MINQKLFNNYKSIYTWVDKYYQSIENLKKMNLATPGVTPTEVVFEVDKIKLRKFISDHPVKNKPPILISYALVNRFTIADLQEGKSLVQSLLAGGLEVYVIDWGYPNQADKYLDLDDYINYYLDCCVEYILQSHNIKKLNLLGICQGGAFSICYTALHSEKINRLITMVTPVDFQTKNDILSHMVRKVNLQKYIKAYGNISGQNLNVNFNMLQPISLNLKKWIDSVHSLSDENFAAFFLNMESWIKDSPDQAGKAYAEFITDFYQHNKLLKGTLYIGGRKIETRKNITMPTLNIYGSQDHLVPSESSKAFKKIVAPNSNYSELEIQTGHIGMYVSGKAKEVPFKILEWLDDNI